jgi:hypothetical protein
MATTPPCTVHGIQAALNIKWIGWPSERLEQASKILIHVFIPGRKLRISRQSVIDFQPGQLFFGHHVSARRNFFGVVE